jgi:protein-tyrosine phosphatase
MRSKGDMDKPSFNQGTLTEIGFALTGRVYRSPMPFRPDDELGKIFHQYQDVGIQVVVVLVEQKEFLHYTGMDLIQFYRDQGLEVIHFPIPDYGTPPSQQDFYQVVSAFLKNASSGKNVAVHCNAGIGRTGTFLACAACLRFGISGEQAVAWIRQFIPPACERQEQVEFVVAFGNRQVV